MGPAWNAWPSRHATQRRQVLQQSLRFAHDRYKAGHASDLEELDALRNLYAAELEVVRLHQAALDNRVQLYKALGGLAAGRRRTLTKTIAISAVCKRSGVTLGYIYQD